MPEVQTLALSVGRRGNSVFGVAEGQIVLRLKPGQRRLLFIDTYGPGM
jgi:hypothetical protein